MHPLVKGRVVGDHAQHPHMLVHGDDFPQTALHLAHGAKATVALLYVRQRQGMGLASKLLLLLRRAELGLAVKESLGIGVFRRNDGLDLRRVLVLHVAIGVFHRHAKVRIRHHAARYLGIIPHNFHSFIPFGKAAQDRFPEFHAFYANGKWHAHTCPVPSSCRAGTSCAHRSCA